MTRYRGPRLVARALLAAALSLSFAPAPAHATPGGIAYFSGVVHIGCFGCGTYGPLGNRADLAVVGVSLTGGLISGSVTSTRTATDTNEGFTVGGAGCPISGSAVGDTDGVVKVHFNVAWVGAVALVTTTGDMDGVAVATFVITSPIGVPCGGPVDAMVSGVLTGT